MKGDTEWNRREEKREGREKSRAFLNWLKINIKVHVSYVGGTEDSRGERDLISSSNIYVVNIIIVVLSRAYASLSLHSRSRSPLRRTAAATPMFKESTSSRIQIRTRWSGPHASRTPYEIPSSSLPTTAHHRSPSDAGGISSNSLAPWSITAANGSTRCTSCNVRIVAGRSTRKTGICRTVGYCV